MLMATIPVYKPKTKKVDPDTKRVEGLDELKDLFKE